VAHADLDDPQPQLAGTGQHLRVDEEVCAVRQELRERLPPEHLQSTVAVAHPRADQPADEVVVAPREEPPPPRVLPTHAVADDHGGLVGQGSEALQVGKVELAVGVGEGDQVTAGGLEAGAQGRPVAAVDVVPQQPDARPLPSDLGDDGGGLIAAAIVHDEDFVIPGEAGQGVVGFGDGLGDAGGFVVGGED
jgi:hypothetical protein